MMNMNRNLLFKNLRALSKEVCLKMCPYSLVDCPKNCIFQKLLIEIVTELSR